MGLCPICACEFEPQDEIVNLPCYISHQVHKACFVDYEKFNARTGKDLLCPICRK